MTKEDKELLLKDICARLPYGIFVKENRESLNHISTIYTFYYHPYIDNCKPYLRSMSSMTEEEKIELYKIAGFYYISNNELLKDEWRRFSDAFSENKLFLPYPIWGDDLYKVYNWLNEHRFDYNNLISMGLALKAPEGMY